MLANITDDNLKQELTDIQRRIPIIYRYIIARSVTTDDSKACRAMGYEPNWIYSNTNRDYYNNLAERLACDRLLQAGLRLQELLPHVIDRLAELVDSDNQRVAMQAVTLVLDKVGLENAIKPAPVAGSMRNLADVILNVYGAPPVQADIIDGSIVDVDTVQAEKLKDD